MWTPSHRQICLSLVVGLVCVFSPEPGHSAEEQLDILELDLGQLMQTEVIVTSVSKRPQKLHEAASAIFVVTQEDIRRTGAVNIMEALRIVPGLQVARIDQTQYTISARGFLTSQFGSNKLLVLMDGRTIYNPSFAGVIWAAQDTMMEDIDRIEVMRSGRSVVGVQCGGWGDQYYHQRFLEDPGHVTLRRRGHRGEGLRIGAPRWENR